MWVKVRLTAALASRKPATIMHTCKIQHHGAGRVQKKQDLWLGRKGREFLYCENVTTSCLPLHPQECEVCFKESQKHTHHTHTPAHIHIFWPLRPLWLAGRVGSCQNVAWFSEKHRLAEEKDTLFNCRACLNRRSMKRLRKPGQY